MKISVIGAAGCIGASISVNPALGGLARELVMADVRIEWLEHHCIDVFDAAAVAGLDVDVRMGRHADIAGSDIVILAAGSSARPRRDPVVEKLPLRQRMLPEHLEIIREWMSAVNEYCPQAIVITATNPAEILNHAAYLFGGSKDRRRFIGYPLNDTIRFKIATARVLGTAPSEISGLVIGEHGGSMVSLFSTVTRNGKPAAFTADQRTRILEITSDYLPHMLRLGLPRSSGWLTGAGVAGLVRAIAGDTREIIPGCAVLDGEYGYSDVSIGVPVVLGREGIVDIVELELTPEEKALLDKSVDNLAASTRYVREHV